MKLLREYIRVLLEQDQGSKGSLVVVDIQPEYESNTPFDIGDMLRTAAEDYSRVLFLFNGEDTLGMVSESALKNFYFEKLDYDEEVFDELLSKSEFFDKGYGFFRDVMDSSVCFDRTSIVKIVKHMIDNDIQDIRDLEEEDVEAIGVNELLFDDLEDYGFWVPELSETLPSWSGSDLAGGARNECMAEVEILGTAQGLSFNHVNRFIYEGDNRYTEALTESSVIQAGQCYPFAVNMAKDSQVSDRNDLKKFKVVHGTVTDKFSGKSYDHAWVEKDNMIFDWQTSMTKPDGISRDTYYNIFQPTIHKEYTAAETIMKCVETQHAGPWGKK